MEIDVFLQTKTTSSEPSNLSSFTHIPLAVALPLGDPADLQAATTSEHYCTTR